VSQVTVSRRERSFANLAGMVCLSSGAHARGVLLGKQLEGARPRCDSACRVLIPALQPVCFLLKERCSSFAKLKCVPVASGWKTSDQAEAERCPRGGQTRTPVLHRE